MPKVLGPVGILILLIALGISCESTTPVVDMSVVSQLQSIPAEYGALVSVTTLPEYSNWMQLWFQDDQGTIRMVRVQFISNLIHNDVVVIARN